jgi:hypothetical protein
VGGELDTGKTESKHRFAKDKKSGQGERGAIGGHAGQGAELGEGEREQSENEGFEIGKREGVSLEFPSFHILTSDQASVGVACSARESGTGFSGRDWNFFEGLADGMKGMDPLVG